MAVRRNLAWMGVSQASFFVVQFGGSVIIARLLSPLEMGIYAVAAAVAGMLGVLQSFGLGSYLVREKEVDRDTVSTVFTLNLLLALTLSAAIATAAWVAPAWTEHDGVRQLLLLLAVLPLLQTLDFVPYYMIERQGDFRTIAFLGAIKNLFSTALTVVLAFAGQSYLSFGYGQVAAALLVALFANVIGRKHAQFRLSTRGWRPIGAYGFNMLAISGVNTLSVRLCELLLAKLLGVATLGIYVRASNVYGLLWDKLHLVTSRVLLVHMAQQKRSGQSIRNTYLLACEFSTAALWPALTGLAVLSESLIHYVYGAKWTPAAPPLAFLSLAGVVLLSLPMTWEVFNISGETGRQARFEFIRTAAGTALFGAACLVSLNTAAAARAADALMTMLLYRPHIHRMTQTRWADFLPVYARSGLLTLLAVGPASVLVWTRGDEGPLPLVVLAGAIALGMGLWCLGLAALRHVLFREITRLLAKRFRLPVPKALSR